MPVCVIVSIVCVFGIAAAMYRRMEVTNMNEDRSELISDIFELSIVLAGLIVMVCAVAALFVYQP